MAKVWRSVLCTNLAPRAHLFSRYKGAEIASRSFSQCKRTAQKKQADGSAFNIGAAPPRLPKEEQEIFETLQRQSTGAFSTPRSPPKINQSPDSTESERKEAESQAEDRADKMGQQGQASSFKEEFNRVIQARGKGEELHPDIRRGARPEFDGDTNPKTGEVGGPKNEPLRWGASGEWSYNGRTTDF